MPAQDQRLPDIARLWMLRLLTLSKPHIKAVKKGSISDEGLAEPLGIEEWALWQEEPEDSLEILKELHKQRQLLEQRQPKAPAKLQRNLQGLVSLLALSASEVKLLEFVALYQLNPALQDCCELSRERDSFDLTTRSLAIMLQLPQKDLISALSEEGRLSASGMLNIGGFFNHTVGFSDLEFPSSDLPRQLVHERLQPLDMLKSIVRAGPDSSLDIAEFDHLQTDLNIVMPYLRRALRERRVGVNILLHGQPGTGKTELCRCLAKSVGGELFELDYDPTQDGSRVMRHRLQYYRAAQTLLPAKQSLVLFDEADDVFEHPGMMGMVPRSRSAVTEKSVVNRVLEQNRIPTFWIINDIQRLDPAYVRRFDAVIAMDTLPRAKRRQIVANYCSGSIGAEHLDRLAELEALTPAIVARAMRVVRQSTRSKNKELVGDRVEYLVHQTLKAQG